MRELINEYLGTILEMIVMSIFVGVIFMVTKMFLDI